MTEPSMSPEETKQSEETKPIEFTNPLFLVLPLIVLAGALFLAWWLPGFTAPFTSVPAEALIVERIILQPNSIDLVVRNDGPESLTIAQVTVNDAAWAFFILPGPTVPRLGRADVNLTYEWIEGQAYEITLFTHDASTFTAKIPAAFTTPQLTNDTLLVTALIGLLIGLAPIYLGFLWLPLLRPLASAGQIVLLAAVVGAFILRGVTVLVEGLTYVDTIPGPFQGAGLIGLGGVSTFLLLTAISRRQSVLTEKTEQTVPPLTLAHTLALGIGLFGLSEGALTGLAYNRGELMIGSLLLAGLIVQNIPKGLGIIASLLRHRPKIDQLILMGIVGGFPVLLGFWLGGFAPNLTLAMLFLGIGLGAILAVIFELARLIQRETTSQPRPVTIFAGVVLGMVLMWVIGVVVN